MAIIGDCDYWSYPSGRSVRLYTDGCVVDSGTGLMGPCKRWLLAEECMKVLCKDLRYGMPERLITGQSTAEDDMPRPTLQFKLVGPEDSDEVLPEG